MRRWQIAALAAGLADPAWARPADALARDLTAYAVASCLSVQGYSLLREQGLRWAGAVIQRGAGPIEAWLPIADAVKAELARSGIRQRQGEGPAAPTVPLPVMTCGEIAAAPAVASAIRKARAALGPSYRRKREP